jgi:hypothetical protein
MHYLVLTTPTDFVGRLSRFIDLNLLNLLNLLTIFEALPCAS